MVLSDLPTETHCFKDKTLMFHRNTRGALLLSISALLAVASITGVGSTPRYAIAQDDPVTELITVSEEDLNAFWEQTFIDEELGEYQPPEGGLTAYEGDEPIETECGETEAENASFCPADQGIYYDITWLTEDYDKSENNGYTVVGTIAHEWGHHIQYLLEQEELQLEDNHYSIEIELQADCFAGSFSRYLYDGNGSLEITSEDLQEGMNDFYESGDEDDAAWDDEEAHGTSAQRSQAFLMGYNQGVSLCLDMSRIAEIAELETE
jgi:predicted metalloprotease